MRLLAKEEVSKHKNQDRAREITEGLKISTKVDNLRKLMAEEEATLEKFRRETLASIQVEILTLETERESLSSEVKSLRTEKERGLSDVREAREVLEGERQALNARELLVSLREESSKNHQEEAQATLKEAQDELARARTHTEEAGRKHEQATKELAESSRTIYDAEQTKEKSLAFKEITELTLAKREDAVVLREVECEKKEALFEAERKSLDLEKLRLKDERQTLERAMRRIQS
jgi:hypothetical protein